MGSSGSKPLVEPLPISASRRARGAPSKIHASLIAKARREAEQRTQSSQPQNASSPAVTPASPGPDNAPFPVAATEFYGPPRLPLPIESEQHIPGSPVVYIDRKSETPLTIDAKKAPSGNLHGIEDLGIQDIEIPSTSPPSSLTATVPTLIVWKGSGGIQDQVFLTGTFCNWENKVRMEKNEVTGCYEATVNFLPGVQYYKFIIDQQMVHSPEQPLTVDYFHTLVNWVEVPPENQDAKQPEDQTSKMHGHDQDPDRLVAPATPRIGPSLGLPLTDFITEGDEQFTAPLPVAPVKWTRKIPQYLLDLDAKEGSNEFTRAMAVVATLNEPPTLPSMLVKSVINQPTPQKDDASVLATPSHTQLNHLATSSIKNGVIATSCTTRYKQKFLTTIIYKPAEADDEEDEKRYKDLKEEKSSFL